MEGPSPAAQGTFDPAHGTPATPRKRGRPPSAGLADRRREQLTRAAFEVFVEYPYTDAPVSEIARRAGVGQGTLYRYVEGKRELFDLVVDWCVEQLTDAVDLDTILAAVDTGDEAEAEQAIEDLGDRLYGLVDANPGILRLLGVQAGVVDRELRYRLRGIAATFEALLMRILREATERGWMDLDPREIDVVAHALPGMAVPGMLLVGDEEHDDLGKRADYVASASKIGRSGLLARKGAAAAQTGETSGHG
jgi:AcrR family transcriptional regulator